MPVMPRWNCSVNSTMRRMELSSTFAYSRYAMKSAALSRPALMNSAPPTTITMYISPSKMRFDVPNCAITRYDCALRSRNFALPSANFFSSISSFANDFTTRMPSSESSTCALISPTCLLRSLKICRILVLKRLAK